jgi:CDP-diacylglycerol--serine O-phosphatidyltransferase
MRRIRTLALLPTLFTLGNLVCGFFAIVVAARVDAPLEVVPADLALQNAANCALAGWLIFAAMIFDALDGHVARLTGNAGDFGAQLDSLCDLVTFGVAPGFLLVKLCPDFAYDHRRAVWIIAATFAVCAALRLARFNVETSDDDDHMRFSGLPSPAAASVIASYAILLNALQQPDGRLLYAERIYAVLQGVLPFLALLVAVLMVSRIGYPHLVNQLVRGQRSFNHLVLVVFALVVVTLARSYAPAVLTTAFALYGPVRFVWLEATQHGTHHERLF